MSEWWITQRLNAWGSWARGGLPSLPTMSSIEKARIGRGGVENLSMPSHIAEVDHLVCTAEPPIRIALIVCYAQRGSFEEKAQRLGLTRWALRRRKEQGEAYVYQNL